jgi:hypothetical protein
MSASQNTKSLDLVCLASDIERVCDEYLVRKAPFALPDSVKEFIVKIAYPLSIIGAILTVFAIIGAIGATLLFLGVSTLIFPFTASYNQLPQFNVISLALALVQLGVSALSVWLYFKAIPGLKTRSRNSWKYIYYGYLLGAVSYVLGSYTIASIIYSLIPATVATLIGLYIWFQVKEKYTH